MFWLCFFFRVRLNIKDVVMVNDLIYSMVPTDELNEIEFENDYIQSIVRALSDDLVSGNIGISLVYWSKEDPELMVKFQQLMTKYKLISMKRTKKFASMKIRGELFDAEELVSYRISEKIRKYALTNEKNHEVGLSRSNGKTVSRGLVRKGFAKAGNTEFSFDTKILKEYLEPITKTIVKSMRLADSKKLERYRLDDANYETVVNAILKGYIDAGDSKKYCMGGNVSDSRGRSSYRHLSKVGNPVSSKDFRALLNMDPVVVRASNTKVMNDIWYFIAELAGTGGSTQAEKFALGEKAYKDRVLPEIDLDTEDGRKDLHEVIWLKRIYSELDRLYAGVGITLWTIPVEVDASMSVAQVIGALTGERRLLERTNVIGDTLSDPWAIKGVRRLSGKKVGTPRFYASSASTRALLSSAGINIIESEVKAIDKEFSAGAFSIINKLKDAIVKNYTNRENQIEVTTWGETFLLDVNKFKPSGKRIVVTKVFDKGVVKNTFTREPILVPDFDRMSLFFPTGLVHNIDSIITDRIVYKTEAPVISIHDALIALPGSAFDCRVAYASLLKEVYNDRNVILSSFRESIGATSVKARIAFMKLDQSVQHIDPSVEFKETAMK
jgi:hypothetical protein